MNLYEYKIDAVAGALVLDWVTTIEWSSYADTRGERLYHTGHVRIGLLMGEPLELMFYARADTSEVEAFVADVKRGVAACASPLIVRDGA